MKIFGHFICGLAAAILTLFLGFSLIASGVMRVVLALSMQQAMPWVWVLLSGVVTFLLGLIIVAHWPVSSLYILGLFLGIDLVIAGLKGESTDDEVDDGIGANSREAL